MRNELRGLHRTRADGRLLPVGGLFDMSAAPGLLYHFDAADITDVDASNNVTSWTDRQGGLVRTNDQLAENKPVLTQNVINGHPASVAKSNTNGTLHGAAASTAISGDFTVAIVGRLQALGQSSSFIGDSTTTNYVYLYKSSAAANWRVITKGTTVWTSGVAADLNWHLFVLKVGATGSLSIDSGADMAIGTYATGNVIDNLSLHGSQGSYSGTELAEVAIFSGVQDLIDVKAHLLTKYALV